MEEERKKRAKFLLCVMSNMMRTMALNRRWRLNRLLTLRDKQEEERRLFRTSPLGCYYCQPFREMMTKNTLKDKLITKEFLTAPKTEIPRYACA